MVEEFNLVMQTTNPNWVDVIYPEGPKYMINIANWTCTCLITATKDCVHKKQLKDKIQLTR